MIRISQSQLMRLFTIFLFSSPVIFLIAPMTEVGGFQAWLGLIVSYAQGLLVAYFSIKLGRIEPGVEWLKFGGRIVGKWVHGPIVLLFSLFAIYLSSIGIRRYVDFFTSIYMPDTPAWVLATVIGLCAAIAVRSGLETIVRFSGSVFFLTVLFGILVPFFVGKELQTDMAIAFINDYNWKQIMLTSVYAFPWSGEMFFVLILIAKVKDPQKSMRSMTIAAILSLLFIIMTWLFCMMLFGPKLTEHLTYPVLEMLRFIRIGDFLENVDPMLVSWWTLCMLVKVSLFLYAGVLGISHLLNMRDHRPLSFSLGLLMTGIAMGIASNYGELEEFLKSLPCTISMYTLDFLPVVYLIVYWLRGRKLSPDLPS